MPRLLSDEEMRAIFKEARESNLDGQQLVAARLYNKPYETVTASERAAAKMRSFYVMYGSNPAQVQEAMRTVGLPRGVTRRQARRYLHRHLGKALGAHDRYWRVATNKDYRQFVEVVTMVRNRLRAEGFSAKLYYDYKTAVLALFGKVGAAWILKRLREPSLARRILGVKQVPSDPVQ